MRYLGLLAMLCLAFLIGCAGQVLTPQEQAAKDTYCATKAVWCSTPEPQLSGDAARAKALACAVNTVCLSPVPAAAASAAK